MADDNRSRPYRSSDHYGRPHGGQGHQSGADPLAELARLIGQQNDAHAGYGQEPSYGRNQHQAGGEWNADPLRAPDPYSGNPDAYRDAPSHQAPYPQSYDDPRYADAQYADPQYADPRVAGSYPEQQQYSGQDYRAQGYGGQSYDAPQYADPQYGSQQFNDQQYGAPQYADPRAGQPYGDQPPAYGDQGGGYPQSYGQPPFGQHSDPYYRGAPQGDDRHEDPAPRRRGGLVTVLAVLALAVVGTAAAFGYRAVFGPSSTPIPPVIKADTSPAKVVPATQSGEQGGKAIQDRVGGGNQPERIVGREEAPVDIARAAAPRVVFPGPTANPIAPLPNSPIPQSASSLAPVGTATAAPSSTEPKRVRTVAIRPDQPETGTARASAAEEAAPRASARQQSAPAASNAPLSLSPASAPAPAAAPRPSMRTASAPAANNPPVNNGGGYSVQVTSQRSEGEAQAAYAQLQAKFPSVLGNRQMVIRRAELGDKGVYYRAQLPFGSQREASEFCGSLKDAGGQCVVQRN